MIDDEKDELILTPVERALDRRSSRQIMRAEISERIVREALAIEQQSAKESGTLGYLARNEEKKQEVREFLLARLDNKKKTVKLAAMRALETLGDPRAIAALEKFSTATKKSLERDQAEKSVAALRAVRKPVDDFKNLRQEVLDLQKSDRDLKSELEKLKKKLEANTSSGTPSSHSTGKNENQAIRRCARELILETPSLMACFASANH